MPERRIPHDHKGGVYFLTLTVTNWFYILDRPGYREKLSQALAYYRSSRDLRLFGFVFMLNHIHLIAGSSDTAAWLRDFKRYTARHMLADLAENAPNLRATLGDRGFWQSGNAPKAIETEDFFLQKLNYIHENPVRKGYVLRPEHWLWSSANPECPLQPDPL